MPNTIRAVPNRKISFTVVIVITSDRNSIRGGGSELAPMLPNGDGDAEKSVVSKSLVTTNKRRENKIVVEIKPGTGARRG